MILGESESNRQVHRLREKVENWRREVNTIDGTTPII